jgi:hypothetical protein
MLTTGGVETAVFVSVDGWRRLQKSGHPTLKELLQDERGRGDIPVRKRSQQRRREPTRLN